MRDKGRTSRSEVSESAMVLQWDGVGRWRFPAFPNNASVFIFSLSCASECVRNQVMIVMAWPTTSRYSLDSWQAGTGKEKERKVWVRMSQQGHEWW